MKDRNFTVVTVFNHYLDRGGEERVFESENRLLEQHGIRVFPFTSRTRLPRTSREKIRMAGNVLWSRTSYGDILRQLHQCKADLVHIHNIFPVMSPSVYHACYKAGVPVVQTLHNFRLLCPNAYFFRDGHVCEDCMGRLPWPGVLHGCYRKSRSQTAVLTAMLAGHRMIGTWRSRVQQYIAPSQFAKNKFVEAGFPQERITVKSNFYDGAVVDVSNTERQGALFVGRLSEEKGIHTLLQAWRGLDIPLRVVGDGPLREEIGECDSSQIFCTGWKSEGEVAAEMARAAFLVVPSTWYEICPMVIQEAYAHGLPVIASGLGSLAEFVHNGSTGLHFNAGDAGDLQVKVKWAAAHRKEVLKMGQNAQREYEKNYSPQQNLGALIAIYQEAMEQYQANRPARS